MSGVAQALLPVQGHGPCLSGTGRSAWATAQSVRRSPAGNVVALAGGERGLARNQEVYERSDFFDGPGAAHGDAAHHILNGFLGDAVQNFGSDHGWGNGIDRDIALARHFLGQRFRQADDGSLGAGVRGYLHEVVAGAELDGR